MADVRSSEPVAGFFVEGLEFVVTRGRTASTADVATVTRLVDLFGEVGVIQGEEAEGRRDDIVRAMMTAKVDTIPKPAVDQARRLARQRDHLLSLGFLTVDDLMVLRGQKTPEATRTWLSRQRNRRALFTVSHDRQTLIPSFQLDGDGGPRRELQAVLEALAPSGLGGWALWSWFTSTSSWVGGLAPVDLLDDEPDRVAHAARRFASNAIADG